MIIWELTPEGYIECFVGVSYGVIGLGRRASCLRGVP